MLTWNLLGHECSPAQACRPTSSLYLESAVPACVPPLKAPSIGNPSFLYLAVEMKIALVVTVVVTTFDLVNVYSHSSVACFHLPSACSPSPYSIAASLIRVCLEIPYLRMFSNQVSSARAVSRMINTSKTLSAQQLLLPWRYKRGKHYQCSEYTLKVQTLIEKQND